MKELETIEKLTDAQLEQIADNPDVKMPDSLRDTLSLICAEDMQEKPRKRFPLWAPVAVAAAIVAGVFIFTTPKQPQDSFNDPYLAYAEVERTFALMSDKMDRGLQTAGKAVPVIQKTDEIIERLSK